LLFRSFSLLVKERFFFYFYGMKIGVYGLGRFGSFWAECLAKHNHEVVGWSRSQHDAIPGVRMGTEEEVLNQDVIFFCVAISSFSSVLDRVAGKVKKGAIVLDTCSVKTLPQEWMSQKLEGVTIIPTHPMFGPDSARNGVENLPIVLCPPEKDSPEYRMIKNEFLSWPLSVSEMSARRHDREAAYSQGVTHFVGRMLEKMDMKPTAIATKGYKSLMTIMEQTCNDPLQLFYDLQRYNPYAKEMRLSMQVAIEKVLNALAEQENV
jgi:Prephenate dehydrogenase